MNTASFGLRNFRKFLDIFIAIILFCQAPWQALHADGLQAGFSAVDITPDRPTPMAGYYSVRLSTGTHDPLWCKATYLDDGPTQVALVELDLISTTKWMVDESRKLIEEQIGLTGSNVMISASHSHTGPVLSDPASTRYQSLGGQHPESKRYMLELPRKIAQAVMNAKAAVQQVQVLHTVGSETDLAFNRRFFMTDQTIAWNPGKSNPKILKEVGPVDTTLPIVSFLKLAQTTDTPTPSLDDFVGLHANYTIHQDTVGGTEWSADLVYSFEQALQQVTGKQCQIQYSTGACGDVNHLDVRSSWTQRGHGEAARIGTRLAGAVLRSVKSLKPVDGVQLKCSSEMVSLQAMPYTPDRLAWAKTIEQQASTDEPPGFMDMVEAFRILDIAERNEVPFDVEVQVITLGNSVAWVSLPGEIFVQLGLAIKEGSPYATTMINELANGSIGYIPTQQAYRQGNYEVVSARCQEGSGELLVDAALRQLQRHFQSQH